MIGGVRCDIYSTVYQQISIFYEPTLEAVEEGFEASQSSIRA